MSHDCNLSIQKAETGLGVRVKPCLIQPKQEEHQIVYFLLFIFYHELKFGNNWNDYQQSKIKMDYMCTQEYQMATVQLPEQI